MVVSSHRAVFFGAIAVALGSSAHAEWSFTGGLDYSAGDFGLERSSSVWVQTYEAQKTIGPWAISGVIPVITLNTPTGAGLPTLTETPQIESGRETTRGVGDVQLFGTRSQYLGSLSTFIDLSAGLKVPTADEDRLLGTGVPDVSLRIDVLRNFGAVSLLASGGFTAAGSTDQFDVQNRADFSFGAVIDRTGLPPVGFVYQQRDAIVRGLDPVQEMILSTSLDLNPSWSVLAYGLTGFSDISPDVGLGFRLTYRPAW